ncbi:MAG: hypothetical protein WAU23_12420 [Ferruginibacter sp.]
MLKIDIKYKPILLEALEELMYKLSLQVDDFKGEPLSKLRKNVTEKQKAAEEL